MLLVRNADDESCGFDGTDLSRLEQEETTQNLSESRTNVLPKNSSS